MDETDNEAKLANLPTQFEFWKTQHALSKSEGKYPKHFYTFPFGSLQTITWDCGKEERFIKENTFTV